MDFLELVEAEENRQKTTIPLIASENFAYDEVMQAVGSVLMNKYAEGYAGRRYYQGNKFIDEIETKTIELGKKLFGIPHINVQPYSGSIANASVLFALCAPGDRIAGMKLSAGGHLTHGHPNVTFSGKFFKSVQWDVDTDGKIDYEATRKLLIEEKPKVIFVGTTAYAYKIDFEFFGKVAEEIGAYVVADIAHIAGLVATGEHPNPVPYVHLITSTTHKQLRGPRGAFVGVTQRGLDKDPELAKKIDKAVFPGLQGGPHMEKIAGIGIAFEKAMSPEYKIYCQQIIKNSMALVDTLKKNGLKVFGSENHLMVVEVGYEKGKEMAIKLEEVGIVCNYNTIPHDRAKPFNPSGIRLGVNAVTSMGLVESDMEKIGLKIVKIICQ